MNDLTEEEILGLLEQWFRDGFVDGVSCCLAVFAPIIVFLLLVD